MAICAIILAAGGSKRLGEPKQLVRVDGETLLDRTIRLVRAAEVASIFVVLGAHQENIQAEVDLSGVEVIENSDWESGIASSIIAGVQASVAQIPLLQAAMLLVCDQLMLSESHVRALMADFANRGSSVIVASEYSGVVGIPAIFPATEFPRLLGLKGDEGARKILNALRTMLKVKVFDGGELDIDTPQDLIALRVR